MARRYLTQERGAGAVEFALVLPGLMFLLLGTMNMFLVTYSSANLHSATEAAARYAAVLAAQGGSPTPTTVSAYAQSRYFGPNISAAYTYNGVATCQASGGSGGTTGYQVTSTGTYQVYYGFGSIPMTLKAAACFP